MVYVFPISNSKLLIQDPTSAPALAEAILKEADVFVRTVASVQSEDVHNSSFDIVT